MYTLLAGVFALSVGAASFLPINEIFRGIFATPALLALIGALYQLARDHAEHERTLDVQRRQQLFDLGAMSHMANVTFDKHVEFCEKYMSEVDSAVTTLYRKGTTTEAVAHANKLDCLHREFSAWITDEIALHLAPFENALRQIGARQDFVENTATDPAYEGQRAGVAQSVHQILCRVLNLTDPKLTGNPSEGTDPHVSEAAVKRRIREILGIEKLVNIRRRLIDEAAAYERNA